MKTQIDAGVHIYRNAKRRMCAGCQECVRAGETSWDVHLAWRREIAWFQPSFDFFVKQANMQLESWEFVDVQELVATREVRCVGVGLQIE
jgi:hypothetical protein